MRSKFMVALVVGSVALSAHAGHAQSIVVGRNVQVSIARADTAHSEVTIAADPVNPKRLIACSMIGGGVVAYVTFDGGTKWTAPVIMSGYPRANDPTCAYGPNGVVYFTHKVKETAGPSDLDILAVHRSRDGGKTWDKVIRGPQTTDRPWIAVDTRPSMGPWGRLFVSYNYHVHFEDTQLAHKGDFLNAITLQSSDDGGTAFGTFAMRAMQGDSAHPFRQPGMGGTAVLSNGTALFLYEHVVGGGPNPATGKQLVASSSLKVLRSTDGARSVQPAITVAEIKSSYNLPYTRTVTGSIASDLSSTKTRDNLYVAWGDVRTGRTEIMVSRSSDAGSTWSAAQIVSDAPMVVRDSGGPDNFMPAIAVNKDGVVGLMWYDRRDNPDNRGYWARFSASLDGGVTWLPSVRVSTNPNTIGGKSSSGVTSGDTAGLTASADGLFHALWIDNRTGTKQVWTAPITVKR